MPWEGQHLGRIAFDGGEAGEVSLFIIPTASFQYSDEARVRFAQHDYRTKKLGCCRAVCWDEGGEYVCVMFGDCKANDLLAYAEAWKAAHNVRTSEGSSIQNGDAKVLASSIRSDRR